MKHIKLVNEEPNTQFYDSLTPDNSPIILYAQNTDTSFITKANGFIGTVSRGVFRYTFNGEEGELRDAVNGSFTNLGDEHLVSCHQMFNSCIRLTDLDLSNLDTSQVTDMSEMFTGCELLANLNLSNLVTSKVEDMTNMFSVCESLTSLDLSHFNTSRVVSMEAMFSLCSHLTTLILDNLNLAKLENTDYMFYSCDSLTDIYMRNCDIKHVQKIGLALADAGLAETVTIHRN